ncbi:iron complex transport system substrate-binding protein [Halogranum gelatinilyticum]|uniref:Iron complex transport system substrate-binding protein n=1 Tax=Halogranum gelatinilyticum TaxID=660521 RepID=A0A1G9QVW5_9EURY|nr:PGF-CTERM-anchored ABC transporter substrate-binding protein [Halogranum gelatinilyticum]SDM15000.1 iron complex transport system substrate-binding protein [Halogranum gelatinilyticum]
MRTTRAMLIALLVTLSVVGAGLGPATAAASASVQEQTQCSFPFTATDATGTEITVDERPERVTTLNPSAAQTMWEIGGREQVVGLSQFALYLDGAESRQNVSAAGFGVNNEKVVGTDPDLVLAPNSISNETVLALRDAGLTVFRFESATSIEAIEAKTTLTGQLTGNCAGAAEANAWMTQNVDAAQTAVEGAERPRVIYPLGGGFVAGDETFIDAMITASGGSNVVADFGLAGYPELSDEEVIESGPEVVLISTPGGAAILDSEPYASTPAAENNRTVYVERNYLNQPAPRSVVYAVGNMTAGFHPDAYGGAQFVTRAEVAASMETDEPTETTQTTTTPAPVDDTPATAEPTDATSPGFGVAAAVLALVATTLLATRRR